MTKPSALLPLAAALLLCGPPPSLALTWTCESVVLKGDLDPAGDLFRGRFDDPAINGQGDVVFHAKARKNAGTGGRRLYLYEGGGASSIVAGQGQAAPGGGAFTKFGGHSINDAGDVGFFGDLSTGEGVFVRPAAASITAAARQGDASPAGGTFNRFLAVSRVNSAGDLAFVASGSGGPDGVFFFDLSATTVSAVAVVGDATGDGRTFCEFPKGSTVGLSDLGNAVFRAVTSTDCALDPLTAGIWQQAGGGFANVADIGDATPLGGTTYVQFSGALFANAADKVLFRGRTAGLQKVDALFVFDPAGPSTVAVAVAGDVAPGPGGTLKRIRGPGGLSDAPDDRALFRSSIRQGFGKSGVFLFGATNEAVVLGSDSPPSDRFDIAAIYRKIMEETGVDRSGTWVTYWARVRDFLPPRGKVAVFRCEGS